MTLLACFKKYKKALAKAKHWNTETTRQYESLVGGLQESIHQLGIKNFEDMVFSDYDMAIQLQIEGRKAKGKPPYSVSTIYKKRLVLMTLCSFHEKQNPNYINPLWGCCWDSRRERPRADTRKMNRKDRIKALRKEHQDDINEVILLPKSLTIKAESFLARQFASGTRRDMDGECVAGLLMLYLGLRPAECCAVKYRNIKEITPGSGRYMLYIYEQLDSSGKVRNTLKTKNAYRIMPLPDELVLHLSSRKQMIQDTTGVEENKILSYPIVNGKNGFSDYNNTKTVSRELTRMLRSAEVSESSVSYLSGEMHGSREIREADPTTYLLRRNFATVMSSVCQMKEDELQYLMGHELENGERRSAYIDPEVLLRIADKMERRHLTNLFQNTVVTLNQIDSLGVSETDATVTISEDDLSKKGTGEIILDLYDACPAEGLKIKISKLDKTQVDRGKPAIEYSCDYRKCLPEDVGRIDTARAYYRAVNRALRRSKLS